LEQVDETFALVPQLNIAGVGRVDFAIFIPRISVATPLVVVECDGHQFHERTPDQASKDRKRIRALQRLGIAVMPFTGTDVIRDSIDVGFEVAQTVDAKLNEKRAQERIESEQFCQAHEIQQLHAEIDDLHTPDASGRQYNKIR
jgi:very-short-patch-repair endonuclease